MANSLVVVPHIRKTQPNSGYPQNGPSFRKWRSASWTALGCAGVQALAAFRASKVLGA